MSFDDPNLVANIGLILVGTLVLRLGLKWLVNRTVQPEDASAGRVRDARS